MFKFSLSLIDYISIIAAEMYNEYNFYIDKYNEVQSTSSIIKELDDMKEGKNVEIMIQDKFSNKVLIATINKVKAIHWVKFDIYKNSMYYDLNNHSYTSKEKKYYSRNEVLLSHYNELEHISNRG